MISASMFLQRTRMIGFVGGALVASGLLLAGCETTNTTASDETMSDADANGGTVGQAAPDGEARTPEERIEQMQSALDRRYVVGPTAADQIGYRVMWNVTTPSAGTITNARIAGDSLFTVNEDNSLTRVIRETGATPWSWPVAGRTDDVLGVRRAMMNGQDLILVITEGDLHVFNTGNGVQVDRQKLSRVAATAPTLYGDLVIYGSLNGEIVWHHFGLGTYVRGYALRGAVTVAPKLFGGAVFAVTDRGHVMAIDAGSASQYWSRYAREGIVAEPAVTRDAVYVASLDQYIRCYRYQTGEVLWSRLHAGPLREPPVIIGDQLYLQTPDQGLVCYEALPFNDLDGNVLWTSQEVSGTIIGRHQGNLLAWDAEARVLTLVDEKGGFVVRSIPMPKVQKLVISAFDSGELFAIGDGGEITRLVPRT